MAGDSETNVKITGNASSFRAAAEEAARVQGQLREKLIDLKSEHVKSGRVARFYAAEISEMVPASEAAREAIQSLVKVVLAEGVFGAAIAGVGLVVASFHALAEATSASKEEFKKLEEAAAEYAKKTRQHVIDVIAALHGETEAQRLDRQETVPLLVQKIGLVDKLHDAEKRLADISNNTDENGGVADIVGLVRAQTEVDGLKARLEALQTRLDSSNEGSGDLAKDAAKTAARKKATDAQNASIALRKEMLDAENVVSTELWARDVDRQQVAFDSAETLKKQEADYALMVRDAENFLDPIRAAQFAEEEAAKAEAEKDAILRQEEADAKKLATELEHAAKRLGEEFGSAIGEMVRGTKSLDDVIGEMLQSLLKAAVQLAAMQAFAAGGPLGILGGIGIETIGGALGGLLGGGGGGHGSNLTVNMHNSFHGNALDAANSQQFQTAVINTIRTAQRRGRL